MEYTTATLENSLDDIFRIGKESFNDFYPKDKFLKRLQDKKYWIYIAKEDKMVGFKVFYQDKNKDIYDWLDGVSPSYRRRGIASRLMNMEIDFAKQNGYSKIKLKTHDGHPEMISLCKKFGFVEEKREPNHWKDSINREAIFFELNV